jgi:hypothetical protein
MGFFTRRKEKKAELERMAQIAQAEAILRDEGICPKHRCQMRERTAWAPGMSIFVCMQCDQELDIKIRKDIETERASRLNKVIEAQQVLGWKEILPPHRSVTYRLPPEPPAEINRNRKR